ncbi:MAG: type II secretion system F family protein [Nitrospirales bacterium]
MPIFEYMAKTGEGKTLQGEILAATSREAIQLLRGQDVMVTRLKEKVDRVLDLGRWSQSWSTRRVTNKDLVVFTHQLATLIRAGVPLLECLDILSSEAENPTLKQIIDRIREAVERGTLLAQAMSVYPDLFHEFYRSMVEVGETTGRLDESLAQLAIYLDKQAQLRSKILSALAYPGLLVTVAITVLVFLLIWVVPLFSGLFQDMGESLPWLTQMVIQVADSIRTHWLVVAGILGGTVLGVKWMLHDGSGRKVIDGLILRIPFLGSVFRKAAIVRFARTLGFLIRRGVSLLPAMDVAGTVMGNRVLAKSLKNSAAEVQDGKPLSETLRTSGEFPPLVTQMIKVGESTGSLDDMLDKVADLFEQEVDRSVATFTSVLEPLVILVVGSGIALVVVAMYLPIFSIGSVIG